MAEVGTTDIIIFIIAWSRRVLVYITTINNSQRSVIKVTWRF